MPTLPSNVSFGRVIGRVVVMDADGLDVDLYPDAVAPDQGTVTFTPEAPVISSPGGAPPTMMFVKPVTCRIDSEGVVRDAQNADGVYLVATNDTDLNRTGWTYRVKIIVKGFREESFSIAVPAGGVVDLAVVAPVTDSTGIAYVVGPVGPVGPTGPTGPAAPDASTTVKGIAELATGPETVTGSDAVRATTPAGVKAAIDALGLGSAATMTPATIAADPALSAAIGSAVLLNRTATMNLRKEVTPSGTNDTAAVNAALASFAAAGGGKIIWPRDNWVFSGATGLALTGTSNPIHIEFEDGVDLDMTGYTSGVTTGLLLGGSATATTAALGADVAKGAEAITCALPCVAGDIIRIKSTVVFETKDNQFKGELAEVLSVAAGVITLKSDLWDSYTAATTTVTLMQMPRVTVEGEASLRRNTNNQGLQIAYARDVMLGGMYGEGARERLFYLNHCHGATADNLKGRDFWYSGTTTSYGLVVAASQHIKEIGNDLRGGRHAISHGGFHPVRDIEVIGGTFDSRHSSFQASVDFHADCEDIKINGATILNGLGCNGSNLFVGGGTSIKSTDKAAVDIGPSRSCEYIKFKDVYIESPPTYPGVQYTARNGANATTLGLLELDATIRAGSSALSVYPFSSGDTGAVIERLVTRGDFKSGAAGNGVTITKAGAAAVQINKREHHGLLHAPDGAGLADLGSTVGETRIYGELRTDKANGQPYTGTGSLDVYLMPGFVLRSTNATKYRSEFQNTGVVSLDGGLIDGGGSQGGLNAATASEALYTNVRRINTTSTPTLPARHYSQMNVRGNVVTVGTVAPTTGTWAVGDECVNSAPVSGGVSRWRCTTAGTPGTWTASTYVGQATSGTAALAAIGNAINTADKYLGKTVFNTNTAKLLVALGSTAGSVWANAATGATEHTPV